MSTSLEQKRIKSIITNVRTFNAQASDHLNGLRELPDAQLISACGPTPSVAEMTSGLDANGPFIAATINHKGQRTPRLFDPWYMAALLLLEASGGKLRFHSNKTESDPTKHYYVVFSASMKEHGLIRVLRIVANTSPDVVTVQLPGDHRNYRRSSLDKLHWHRKGS